jgi:hypothetical protein
VELQSPLCTTTIVSTYNSSDAPPVTIVGTYNSSNAPPVRQRPVVVTSWSAELTNIWVPRLLLLSLVTLFCRSSLLARSQYLTYQYSVGTETTGVPLWTIR